MSEIDFVVGFHISETIRLLYKLGLMNRIPDGRLELILLGSGACHYQAMRKTERETERE